MIALDRRTHAKTVWLIDHLRAVWLAVAAAAVILFVACQAAGVPL